MKFFKLALICLAAIALIGCGDSSGEAKSTTDPKKDPVVNKDHPEAFVPGKDDKDK